MEYTKSINTHTCDVSYMELFEGTVSDSSDAEMVGWEREAVED